MRLMRPVDGVHTVHSHRHRTNLVKTGCKIVILIYHIHIAHLIIFLPSTLVIVLILHVGAKSFVSKRSAGLVWHATTTIGRQVLWEIAQAGARLL